MEAFQDYAYYYNAFYRDKDYAAEARQVDALLKKYGTGIRKIINFGCGTGRHDIELSKIGYICAGIDISPMMIGIAKENSGNEHMEIDFSVADIRSYAADEKYDAVISLFHVMSYQNGNDDVMAAFMSARESLNTGGVFAFDAWYGPGVLSDKPSVRVKEAEDARYRLIRIARPIMHEGKNTVDVRYEVLAVDKEANEARTINEVHKMRYFFRPEIEFYLKQAGFELIDNLDCATLGKTGFESWTSYFICRAV